MTAFSSFAAQYPLPTLDLHLVHHLLLLRMPKYLLLLRRWRRLRQLLPQVLRRYARCKKGNYVDLVDVAEFFQFCQLRFSVVTLTHRSMRDFLSRSLGFVVGNLLLFSLFIPILSYFETKFTCTGFVFKWTTVVCYTRTHDLYRPTLQVTRMFSVRAWFNIWIVLKLL